MKTSLTRDPMSVEERVFLEPVILAARVPNGRKPANHRLVMDSVFRISLTGVVLRGLPEEFGVYRQFGRWPLTGPWEDIMEALNRRKAVPDALQMIDSTVVRAHHQAAGSKRGLRDRVSAVLTTKIHLLGNRHELPVRTGITPSRTSDYRGFDLMMADNMPAPSVLLADPGYDADHIRTAVERRNALPLIPMRKSRKVRIGVGRSLYRLCNLVERCFNKLKNARHVATR